MTGKLLIIAGITFLLVAGAVLYRRRKIRQQDNLLDIPPFLRRDQSQPDHEGISIADDWTEIHPLPKSFGPRNKVVKSACEMGEIKTPGYAPGSIDIFDCKDSPCREALYRHWAEAEQGFVASILNRIRRRLRDAAH